jgi:uncharacterized membrane protein YfcA
VGGWDPAIAVAGLVVGVVVGLTGMGGGALMTPVLVFVFGVQPLAAVSSDIVASLFMKPVGGLVHLRNGTVHLGLVRWLCVGSVPGALGGVLLLRLIGHGQQLQHTLLLLLGGILVVASLALTLKAYLNLRARAHRRATGNDGDVALASVSVRRPATALVGAVGGLMVGLTSVGAGSVLIVCLLLLYPTIRPGQLVGTDLVQAVPLVAAASLGHLLFGDFTMGLTGSILVGAIPGVWFGARLSSHSRGMLVRRALAIVMLASGAKLLGASTGWVALLAGATAVVGPIGWALVRVRHSEPAFVLPRWYERSLQRRRTVTPQVRRA